MFKNVLHLHMNNPNSGYWHMEMKFLNCPRSNHICFISISDNKNSKTNQVPIADQMHCKFNHSLFLSSVVFAITTHPKLQLRNCDENPVYKSIKYLFRSSNLLRYFVMRKPICICWSVNESFQTKNHSEALSIMDNA